MDESRRCHKNFIEQKSYQNTYFDEEETSILLQSSFMKVIKNGIIFQVVGVAVMERYVIYVLPKFEVEDKQDAKDGTFYVQAIKRYLLSESRRSSTPTLDNIPLIMRTYEELDGFYRQFGIYKERRNIHVSSEIRSTNWQKTIIKNQSILSDISEGGINHIVSALYNNPIVNSYSSYEGEISNLFKNTLILLSTFISPIMGKKHSLDAKLTIDRVIDQINKIFSKSSYYKRILKAHIAVEAGLRKKTLRVLYNFISHDSQGLAKIFSKRIFVFGTQDFELVWEDACINVLKATRGSKDLFNPKSSSPKIEIGKQKVDGIIHPDEDFDKVTIIDAKYYVDRSNDKIRLPIGDVMKQYGYAVSARATWQRSSIKNFMIFPSLSGCSEKVQQVGSITLEKEHVKDEDFDPIILLKVNPEEIFPFYIKKSHNILLRDIIRKNDGIMKESVFYRAKIGNSNIILECTSDEKFILKTGSKINLRNCSNLSPAFTGLVQSMMTRSEYIKGGKGLYKLNSDFDCGSLYVATRIASPTRKTSSARRRDPNKDNKIWEKFIDE